MPQKSDRVQREIEDLLNKLDNFVPEERFISKVKSKRKAEAGPGLVSRMGKALGRPFRRITLGHVMLAGIALMLTAWLAPNLYGDYARMATLLGLVLAGAAMLLSFMGWDSRRTIAGGGVEKRWRGQVIRYDQPTGSNKVRDWFRKRGRR
ncbi:MAG: hypothetical protein HY873_10755 [Chloroflexi bacterium]|nr:hypothetical protein [Chloroflexota bacterium]